MPWVFLWPTVSALSHLAFCCCLDWQAPWLLVFGLVWALANYYYKRVWLKCHKVLGLQEHFTIEKDAEEQHRTAISNRVQAETWWEKFCLEGWQWRWRGDARRQAVPYTRSRDRKCAVADGGVARRRYNECRRWRRPKAPSRIYVRHSVEFIGEVWRSHRMQTTVCEHANLNSIRCGTGSQCRLINVNAVVHYYCNLQRSTGIWFWYACQWVTVWPHRFQLSHLLSITTDTTTEIQLTTNYLLLLLLYRFLSISSPPFDGLNMPDARLYLKHWLQKVHVTSDQKRNCLWYQCRLLLLLKYLENSRI